MASKTTTPDNSSTAKPVTSESGLVSNYSIEVIGLLSLATLIYATFALLLIS